MSNSRPLLCLCLVLVVSLPGRAQQLAPSALRASDVALTEHGAMPFVAAARARDTLPTRRREISPVGTVLGGIAGGVAGTFVGLLAGSSLSEGCQGEMCQFGPVILGGVIGESVGLALGAHLGSRSTNHGHVLGTALTSAGIAVVGAVMGAGIGRAGMMLVPLTPAFQLAAALAIEAQ
jgi:hypothetical protein